MCPFDGLKKLRVLVALFYYLNRYTKRYYFTIWTAAWLFYALWLTIGLSVLTAILFGLFPALHISTPDLSSALKEASGRSGTGLRHNRARSLLVLAEMLGEETLNQGGEVRCRSHHSPPRHAGGLKSAAAALSSSGVAVMYQ